MDALLGAAQWVVGKALAPVADGVLEAWEASNKLGLNIDTLKIELLLVKATLELAGGKQIRGEAMEQLLGKLQDLAHCAEDLLDELDYFRIHDQLQGTYDAAYQHAKGGVHDLDLNARHVAKAVGKLAFVSSFCCSAPSSAGDPREDAGQRASCCAWPRPRQRAHGNSSSARNANQEVSVCMPKLDKLVPCSSCPRAHDNHSCQPTLYGAPQRETPILDFNRVVISERMRHIVEQLQPVRKEITQILQSCDRITILDIAQHHPITTGGSIEPKLYGRDHIMHTIIHDMTEGKYSSNNLTVLPIVGAGGIGKTTLIQHIHKKQQVENHFQVVIWVCVSLKFNLNKLLEEIKTCIPQVDGEKDGKAEELIEQRLKSKKFLPVLDDLWEFSDEDDWDRLLLPLKTSKVKGSMILVTTRFPAIAKMIRTTNHSIELEGLESKYIRELFHAFVFGGDRCRRDHSFLLEIGDKIMVKLKGSPLAAKTVGRLLRHNLNLCHWIRVLESKEWERKNGANDIMPALKLSYDYLPYYQQQCFFYSALFPEDHKYSATELINLWIGLDILQPAARNQTFQDIGLNNLNDLVMRGFFREEDNYGRPCYVMHDLLHDLALQVASHECFTIHHSTVGLEEIHPSIRHLSIIIDDVDKFSLENLKNQLRKVKTRLKVKQLHTLMLFGKMDKSFANILGDFFREADALRVLRSANMSLFVESMLHNLALFHLRYLCMGEEMYLREMMQIPLAIYRFYHLRILDLGRHYTCPDLPKEFTNLAKLCHFYGPSEELHSHICNVEKLRLLEELKVFRVNKESEGFEPKQLEHLAELRELGIYNLENIHTKEEAVEANIGEKNYLERLTLDWDSNRSVTQPGVEAVILESLQPHRYLKELCIRGHGGLSCPIWLGDELTVEALESLDLSGVSWEHLPPLGKMWGLCKVKLHHIATIKEFVIEKSFCRLIRLELVGLGGFEKWVPSQDGDHMFPLLQVLIIKDCSKLLELPFSNHIVYPSRQDWNIDWFPKLQKLEIEKCPELLIVACIPWTETLHYVKIEGVKLLGKFTYRSHCSSLDITGKDGLQSLDEVVALHNMTGLEQLDLMNCPPLQLKHLLVLTSLKRLTVKGSDGLAGLVGGEGVVEWQHPLEHLDVHELHGASGKELTELLTHLPGLSKLAIYTCENITQLAVGVDVQQKKSVAAATEVVKEIEKDDSELLLLPAHHSDSLRELQIYRCPELVLVSPRGARGGLEALRSLQKLDVASCRKFSCSFFPSSLQDLRLFNVEGMETLEPLSNLTSLTKLNLHNCGEDLRCKGLGPLLTAGGQLRQLFIRGSPRFFAGWDPNPKRVQLQDGAGEEPELQQLVSPQNSSKLQCLKTDDRMGLCAAPICCVLSSSLNDLVLFGTYQEMECFTKQQEDALHLLDSLQELYFFNFEKLQSIPAGLHKLRNLKKLSVYKCPAVHSLPKDGLPKSLHLLNVFGCGNEELQQQCKGLVGTIPEIGLN